MRRLYTRPSDGRLAAVDSRRRCFPGALRDLIVARDRTCRTPWCDAQISAVDHVVAYTGGGPTDFDNGQGLCARCNDAKHAAGWRARGTPGTTKVVTVTPAGRTYVSGSPDPPGRIGPKAERYLTDLVLKHAS